MGGVLSVTTSPKAVTINADVDVPEDILITIDSQMSASK